MAAGSAACVASPQPARAAPSLWEQARSGLRPEGREDQTSALQRAVDEFARTRKPLVLTAGVYRASGLKLPAGAQVWGTRAATTLVLSRPGASLMSAIGNDQITLSGLLFDGDRKPLPDRKGLAHLENCQGLKIADCTFTRSGGNALMAIGSAGEFVEFGVHGYLRRRSARPRTLAAF